MTTGPPLYVVSACGSAEEFVAAFRRYADRTGLFIPLASPLPAGRRGRIALTLKDGGVMIEGEAEIVQSSVRPTVLHGRPGMTVKFVEPDEPSKVVISELEKARLAMKPAAPSVAPRYAAVPTEPRPTPPTPTGRIDAANALAECVVIGDASSLQDTRAIAPNDKSGGRLAVPGIPSAPRSKMPSAPPPVDKPRNMTSVGFPALGLPPRKPDPSLVMTKAGTEPPANPTVPMAQTPPKVEAAEEATTLGTAPPKKSTDPTIQSPPIDPALLDDEATTFGAIPKKRSTDPMPAVAAPAPPPAAPAAVTRTESSKAHKPTSIGFPAIRGPAFETQARGISVVTAVPSEGSGSTPQPPTLPKTPAGRSAPPPRGKTPTTPPLTPRHPTPVAPVPIVRPPAKSAPQMADEEKTDLGADEPAVITSSLPVDDSGKLMPPPTQRSGGMRASEILAAIPAGDWTMTPDESIPNPLPPEAKVPALPLASEPTPAPGEPPGPPTGNWTISLDPETQSWRAPEKLPKPGAQPTSGNPVGAVASDEPISVVRWDDKPTGIGESKIEIDSDLMRASSSADGAGPPPPTKSSVALDATAPQTAIAHGDTLPPPVAPPAPPRQRQLPYPSVDLRPYQSQPVAIIAPTGKRKKMIAMAIGAVAIAIGAVVVLVMTLSGQDKPRAQAKDEAATVTVPAKPTDEPKGSQHAVVDPKPGSETPKPDEPKPDEPKPDEPKPDEPKPDEPAPGEPKPAADKPPVATGTCTVQLASTPNGADIYAGRKKLGVTPAKLELPCGVETKVSLRKNKFANTLKAFTPQADKPNKLMYRLKRDMVSVKVTSTPPGATITFGGKSVGVTPTTIKLPQFDTSMITLTKPGYSAEKARVTPKQNNAAQHVTLKRGR